MAEETKKEEQVKTEPVKQEEPKTEPVKKEEPKKPAPTNLYEALAMLDGGENYIAEMKRKEAEAKKIREERDALQIERVELQKKYAIADEQNRSNAAKLAEARIHNGELMSRIDRSYEAKVSKAKELETLESKVFGKW